MLGWVTMGGGTNLYWEITGVRKLFRSIYWGMKHLRKYFFISFLKRVKFRHVPYIHFQIRHRQPDLSTNLSNPIYPSLLSYINPRMVLYKYATSLSPHHLSIFLFQANIKATYCEVTPHFKQYYSRRRFNKLFKNS